MGPVKPVARAKAKIVSFAQFVRCIVALWARRPPKPRITVSSRRQGTPPVMSGWIRRISDEVLTGDRAGLSDTVMQFRQQLEPLECSLGVEGELARVRVYRWKNGVVKKTGHILEGLAVETASNWEAVLSTCSLADGHASSVSGEG
jgi:hypothetical protein